MSSPRPPLLARFIVRRAAHPTEREFLLGDLQEEYGDILSSRGHLPAWRWYWLQALRNIAQRWIPARRRAMRAPDSNECARSHRVATLLDAVLTDVAFALRNHRRRPLYTAVTLLTLALAVGANTAIFSVAEAALFRDLPYDDADRIVEIRPKGGLAERTSAGWTPSSALIEAAGIADAAAYVPGGSVTLAGDDGAQQLNLTQVTSNFFRVLGVEMLRGPGLSGDERLAVVAHSVWVQSFASNPEIIGSTIRLSGIPTMVAAVAPPEATFPGRTDVWVSYPIERSFFSDATTYELIARLEDGADRATVAALLFPASPGDHADLSLRAQRLVPLRDKLSEPVRRPLFVLIGAAALVFVLGCLNLAGVALSQVLRRDREFRIRAALGASRGRVSRQLLVEALVLGAGGGLVGLGAGAAGIKLLLAWLPGDVPGLTQAQMGARPILLGGVLALTAGILINAIPLLQSGSERLHSAAHGSTPPRRRVRARTVLAVAQISAAVVLLIAAGLFGRSLLALSRVPLGIDTQSVVTFEAQLVTGAHNENEDPSVYAQRVQALRGQYLETVTSRLAVVPGVVSVGAVTELPLSTEINTLAELRHPDAGDERRTYAILSEATPGYFDAMGIPFVSGRTFSDETAATPEVVLSRLAAEELFGTADATGNTVSVGYPFPERTIAVVVGVVDDIRDSGLESRPQAAVYHPMALSNDATIGIAVRVARDPAEIGPLIAARLAEVVPEVPAFNMQTSRQILQRQLATRRALATVSGLFGAAAVALAVIGIYGLIAESVTWRRREMGIRLALGARPAALVARTAAAGFTLALAGTALALLIATWGSRFLEPVLFEVSPRDPVVMLLTPLLLLAVAAVAAWLPSRRVGHVNPVEVLSAE